MSPKRAKKEEETPEEIETYDIEVEDPAPSEEPESSPQGQKRSDAKIAIQEEESSEEELHENDYMDTLEEFAEEGELAIDVYQTENDIVIQTAIAGVRADALNISIEDDLVTITGERRNPFATEEKEYFHQECFWGPFSREILLPDDVDAAQAQAQMKDGVLTLRIPKIARETAKKIEVEKMKT